MRGRSQAALDIAPLARNKPAAALAAGQVIIPTSSGIGAREIDCDATWEIGSAEESAWRAKIHPDDVIPTRQIVNAALARHRPYGVEYRLLGANRQQRIVQEHGAFAGGIAGYATITDVTERRRQESELWSLAHYDPLTGLPRRPLLLERIAAATAEIRDTGRVVAVFALVVSRFESLDDTFGRATGDELLRLLALRLGESVRGGDTVAGSATKSLSCC